jgi:hypothetical protein
VTSAFEQRGSKALALGNEFGDLQHVTDLDGNEKQIAFKGKG